MYQSRTLNLGTRQPVRLPQQNSPTRIVEEPPPEDDSTPVPKEP